MKILHKISLVIFAITSFTSCMDRIPTNSEGIIIDDLSKSPVADVHVMDKESGYFQYTDNKGRLNIIGTEPIQVIEITKEGYKPFTLEITLERNEDQKIYKSFKVLYEKYWDKKSRTLTEKNSNSFTVLNGDSIIVVLERI